MQQQEESSMQQSFSSSSSSMQKQQTTSSSSMRQEQSSSMRQEQTSSMRQEQSSSVQMQQETKMTKQVHQVVSIPTTDSLQSCKSSSPDLYQYCIAGDRDCLFPGHVRGGVQAAPEDEEARGRGARRGKKRNRSHLMFDLMLFWSPGETDSCRSARGQDEEAAPPSSSSTKGIRLPSKPKMLIF